MRITWGLTRNDNALGWRLYRLIALDRKPFLDDSSHVQVAFDILNIGGLLGGSCPLPQVGVCSAKIQHSGWTDSHTALLAKRRSVVPINLSFTDVERMMDSLVELIKVYIWHATSSHG